LHNYIPAAFISNFTPLMVIVQRDSPNAVPHFEYKMWNLLFVAFGDTLKAGDALRLEELIAHYKEESECNNYLYIFIDESAKGMAFEDFLVEKGYKTLFYNYTPKRFQKSEMIMVANKEEYLKTLMDALAFEES